MSISNFFHILSQLFISCLPPSPSLGVCPLLLFFILAPLLLYIYPPLFCVFWPVVAVLFNQGPMDNCEPNDKFPDIMHIDYGGHYIAIRL